jgi:hypothetical protein
MEAMVMIADDNNGQNTSELYGGVGGVMGSNREREVILPERNEEGSRRELD